MDQQTKDQIDEYHLMIEEVLGGMDIMLSGMNKRVSILEKKIDSIIDKASNTSEIKDLHAQVYEMKEELSSGLNLAFRKINEK
ncbi:hypothetical protein Ping_2689 [Psychromonas ingrahamii 37]|uniref:Uncharacterized protein n=1 Tax=Psychromonas ingrahamii (strain DSM 17664 / CCUG 51855 / 37) TaxID=357804 RepID=A1SY35_PSYIN|nr:hypothetical protein [Psychromonas ingrahamii]ABM04400.1 hypothetical protein Ping_2689 [Psychromonas ingrahamii 37]